MLVKGKQMIQVLNKCHIASACLGKIKQINFTSLFQLHLFPLIIKGNHDFDFGLDVLEGHIMNSNFSWLLR